MGAQDDLVLPASAVILTALFSIGLAAVAVRRGAPSAAPPVDPVEAELQDMIAEQVDAPDAEPAAT